jgi:hypothetical protein
MAQVVPLRNTIQPPLILRRRGIRRARFDASPSRFQPWKCVAHGIVKIFIFLVPAKPTRHRGSGNISLDRQDAVLQVLRHAHQQRVSEACVVNLVQGLLGAALADLQGPSAVLAIRQIQGYRHHAVIADVPVPDDFVAIGRNQPVNTADKITDPAASRDALHKALKFRHAEKKYKKIIGERIVDDGLPGDTIVSRGRGRRIDATQDCREQVRLNQFRQNQVVVALVPGAQGPKVRRGIGANQAFPCQLNQIDLPARARLVFVARL